MIDIFSRLSNNNLLRKYINFNFQSQFIYMVYISIYFIKNILHHHLEYRRNYFHIIIRSDL